ncbi:hypothetical protein [Anaeromicropila populeti]|uniref:Flagellar operon protein TIGR03826 n=1 Tax=Anaeromicropila populeti TaxID=37658 RepID=A0A1I6ID22_9FIRM|nr:hypothetical protein [Anaeromicropila populeti]SFR64608.1 hypothetical protein SAMN05661086_00710 [Anaeromicropila populeti]
MNVGVNGINNISTCARCGKLFQYSGIGLNICQKCKEIDEKEFNLVKEYIYDNPSATVKDTVLNTGVSVRRIRSFLREGRLIIPDGSPIFIECENCGTNIKFGRLCRECADSLTNEIKREMCIEDCHIGERPKKAGVRMHFLDAERKG